MPTASYPLRADLRCGKYRVLRWILMAMICALPLAASASEVPEPFNLNKLTERAQRIFVGTVLSRESGFDALGLPATNYRFRVEQAIKGVAGGEIQIKQTGVADTVKDKATGVYTFPIFGIPVYQVGERYLLFLNADSQEGYTAPVGLGYGAFHVSASGEAINDINNAGLMGVEGQPAEQDGPVHGPMPVSSIVARTQLRLKGTPDAAVARKTVDPAMQAAIEEKKRVQTGGYEVYSNIGALFSGHPLRYNIVTADNPNGTLPAIPWDVETGTLGSANNATAIAKVAESFGLWAGAKTAMVTVAKTPGNIGLDINSTCTGQNVPDPTPSCYRNFYNRFGDGVSPVIFDTDGSITQILTGSQCGLGGLGGFQGSTFDGGVTWASMESYALLNGAFVGGNCNPSGTLAGFGQVVTHELGHFLALAHTIVNGELIINSTPYLTYGVPPCSTVEIMLSNSVPSCTRPNVLQYDDIASVSQLYPNANYALKGKISGTIFSPNGTTPVNCANVVLRNPMNPFVDAYATISGVSQDFGTAPAGQAGSYSQKGLEIGSDYDIQVKPIANFATGASNLTGLCPSPVALPGPSEFYNGADESADPAVDNPTCHTPVTAQSNVTGINVILNSSTSTTASCGPSPAATLSASSLSFATTFQRQTSGAQALTLTNTGGGALYFTGITPGAGNSGDFMIAPNCPVSLRAAQSCTLQVKFRPLAQGARGYSFTVTTSGAANPPQVTLSGTGGELSFALPRPARPARNAASFPQSMREMEMTLMSGGASGEAELACTAPQGMICEVTPRVVELNGAPANFRVTLSAARTARLQGRAPAAGSVTVTARVGTAASSISVPVAQF